MIEIKKDENLSKYTTFHLGGPAKYFVVVKSREELEEALNFTREKKLKYFILGGGSNLLFSDAGFDGLVIKLAIMDINIEGEAIAAGSGAPLLLVVKKAAGAGLAGLENFAGIPGTVGGAVCGNAGAYGKSMSDVLEKAEILTGSAVPSGVEGSHPASYNTEIVDKEWFDFKYRESKLKHYHDGKSIILKVWFKLAPGNKEALQEKIKELLDMRGKKEPRGFCAGCAFKNIKGRQAVELLEKINFSPDEKNLFSSRGAIPAAWFIERAELKGKKIGGAYIAAEHANYIMNDGTGRADDVIMLISFIKQQVRDKFGVQLEEEVEIIV